MNRVFKALGIGVAIEAALIAGLAFGGFGPCGPASVLSAFVFFIHTPGLSAANAIGIREPASLFLVVSSYVMLWSGIALLVLVSRSKPSP